MIITIASVFAACKSNPDNLQTNKVLLTDSSGVSSGSASSDTATAAQKGAKPVIVSKSTSSEKTKTPTSYVTQKTYIQASKTIRATAAHR